MTTRRVGPASLALGLVGAALVQLLGLGAPPLYDGVVPVDPYRWLNPPPGRAGDAKGSTANIPISGGRSPLVAVATPEQPPQAQIFAAPGTLVLPPGTTTIKVSIAPIPPVGSPTDGHIAGNVYHISVTSQDGGQITAPAAGKVSLVMRGPEDVFDATIERFNGTAWAPLQTSPAGLGATFLAVVTDFGDFALVAAGAAPASGIPASGAPASAQTSPSGPGGGSGGFPPALLVAAGLALAAGAIGLLVALRRMGGGAAGAGYGGRTGPGRSSPVPRKGGRQGRGTRGGRSGRRR